MNYQQKYLKYKQKYLELLQEKSQKFQEDFQTAGAKTKHIYIIRW